MATERVIRIDTTKAQKNVDSLEKELQSVNEQLSKLDKSSKAFSDLSKKAEDLNKQITSKKGTGFEKLNNDLKNVDVTAKKASMDLGEIASNMAKVGAGISGGFAIANTAMQLFSVESEEASKAIQNLQNLLLLPISFTAIAEGIQALNVFTSNLLTTEKISKKVQESVISNIDKFLIKTEDGVFSGVLDGKKLTKWAQKFGKSFEDIFTKEVGDKIADTQRYWKEFVGSFYEKDLKTGLNEFETEELIYKNAIQDFAKSNQDALTGFQKFGAVIKASPIKSGISAIAVVIFALIKAINAFVNLQDKKLIASLKRVSDRVDILKQQLTDIQDLYGKWTKNLGDIDNITKARIAIDNINNSYKEYIKNQRTLIELDRQASLRPTGIIGDVEYAQRNLQQAIEGLSGGRKGFAKWWKEFVSGFKGGGDLNITALFEGISQTKFERFDFTKLIGLSDDELQQTAKDVQTQIYKLQEEIKPFLEQLQINLTGLEGKKAAGIIGENEFEAKKTQYEYLIKAMQSYYDSLQTYQDNAINAINGELKAREQGAKLTIEERKNQIAVYKAETERRKAIYDNYELTAEYFNRTVKAYNDEIALVKKGSAEEANLFAQREAFIQSFRKEIEEEFQQSLRQTGEVVEDLDEDMEKSLNRMYGLIKSNVSVWQQLTGDTRILDDSFISKMIETGQWKGFTELIGLTIEANNQFNNLIATMSRFAESSLGLGSQWTNVIADMQTTFNSFALAISKGSEATFTDWGNTVAGVANMTGTFLNALSDEQDANTKEGFEQQKKLQISATVVNMLGGILSAWTSAMNPANAWLTGAGQITLGTVMSSMIASIGAAQIAKIAKQQFGGGASASSNAINSTIIPPVDYSRLVQGSQTVGAIRDTRQYVSVVEIDKVQKRVNVSENEARY